MPDIPEENDTPFSLPSDAPEIMPIDYPALDENIDAHEAYDEGMDDVVDTDPYRQDDDPIKSSKRIMRLGTAGEEKYTLDHDTIRRWVDYRGGYPAHIMAADDGLYAGGLFVSFEDTEPDIDMERIKWSEFFKIFENNKLAFLFRTKNRNGSLSRFYKFMYRDDVHRLTEARRVGD